MASIIESKYIGEAWIRCLAVILKEGKFARDKGVLLKEALNIFIKIKNPLVKDRVLRQFADPVKIGWMEKNFFGKQKLSQFGYNYRQRLFEYNRTDQIKWIINKLRKNPEAKSATITLLKPGHDDKHVPCLVALDFKIRFNKLLMYCFFRSQDIYNKMYADALQLGKLQQRIAKALNKKTGFLYLNIISAHIYKEDFSAAKKILNSRNNDL